MQVKPLNRGRVASLEAENFEKTVSQARPGASSGTSLGRRMSEEKTHPAREAIIKEVRGAA